MTKKTLQEKGHGTEDRQVTAATLPLPSKKNGRPLKGEEKVDLVEAWRLRCLRHWTYEEIARKFQCSRSYVARALKQFNELLPNPEERLAFYETKAEVLEAVQFKMLSSLVHPGKLAKATAGNLGYVARQLDDMIRLHRGQSTANVGILGKLVVQAEQRLGASKATSIPPALPDNSQSTQQTGMNTGEKTKTT